MRKYFNTYTLLYSWIIYLFQILNERKINGTIISQIYLSLILFIILLMNTFFYCNAGELIMGQVSYIIIKFINK